MLVCKIYTEEINLRGMNDDQRQLPLAFPSAQPRSTGMASPAQIRRVSGSHIVYPNNTTPYP